jgi:hypothetical protein
MFGSAMLDIAIGVVFIFLLLSVFATTINELLFSLLSMRGKELLRGIQTLLNDNDLVSKVYNHGQVYGLYQGDFKPDLRFSAASPPKAEAAAPPPNMEVAAPASNTTPPSGLRTWFGGNRGNLPSYIPSRNFALALIDTVSAFAPPKQPPPPAPPADPQDPTTQAQQIVKIAQEVKDGAAYLAGNKATEKVGKPLVSMIATAGDDAARLQQSIEEWFNSGMDRVSGWYKYNTQWCLFWIGLTIAIAINADTISIVKQLSNDSTLRQSIVAAAQSAKEPQNSPDQTTSQRIEAVKQSMKNFTELGVPMGWPAASPKDSTEDRFSDCAVWMLHRLPGWLLSAIAISLGAPFWFDALNKIMIVRSTIKPGEKSPDGKPKDKSQN